MVKSICRYWCVSGDDGGAEIEDGGDVDGEVGVVGVG